MQQSMIGLAFLCALTSCSSQKQVIRIAHDKCWGIVANEEYLDGNADLSYFPNQTSFISNTSCPDKTIGTSLSPDAAQNVSDFFRLKVGDDPNVIGITFRVQIVGRTFRNENNPNPLIRVSTLKFGQNDAVAKIALD
ncbi:hypothetical protein [Sphingobium indicum]|uniref:hypothetical protein n=1 Tax=Sphingobium indicum TaxID=332055 RepID=UPI0012DE3E01|nr:hypothetical protein [Sphingobium indicum]